MAISFPTKANWAAGDILTAAQMDDLAGTVNLLSNASAASGSVLVSNAAGTTFAYQPLTAGGKNGLINGGFDIWQRGTSWTNVNSTWTADRWEGIRNTLSTGFSVSQQTSGLTGFQYCLRAGRAAGDTNTTNTNMVQSMANEEALRFAGQNVTISFYARKGANFTGSFYLYSCYSTGTNQNWVTSGPTGETSLSNAAYTLTTSWQRFSVTVAVPSTATQLHTIFNQVSPTGTAGAADYYEIAGVQLEMSSVATQFSRAGGTYQGELAACQRYYYRTQATNAYQSIAMGIGATTTDVRIQMHMPTTMRTTPTAVEYSTLRISDYTNNIAVSSLSGSLYTPDTVELQCVVTGATQFRTYILQANNSTSAYVGVTAEL